VGTRSELESRGQTVVVDRKVGIGQAEAIKRSKQNNVTWLVTLMT
jgi:hypothetical protein